MTFAWGFVILLYLPDGPHNAKMLSEYERMVAVWRVSKNRMGIKHHAIIPYHIKEALVDPKTHLLLLMGVCTGILNGGVANFISSLIKGFGFDALRTSLLQTPGGAFELVGCMFFGWVATKKNMLGVTVISECACEKDVPLADLEPPSFFLAWDSRVNWASYHKHQASLCPRRHVLATKCPRSSHHPRLDLAWCQYVWSHQENHSNWPLLLLLLRR